MKKVIILVIMVLASIMMCGCAKKNTAIQPAIEWNGQETVVTETILWENVITESWE